MIFAGLFRRRERRDVIVLSRDKPPRAIADVAWFEPVVWTDGTTWFELYDRRGGFRGCIAASEVVDIQHLDHAFEPAGEDDPASEWPSPVVERLTPVVPDPQARGGLRRYLGWGRYETP